MQEIALVTGSNSGIGKAVAIKLALDGYYVFVNYPDDSRRGEAEGVAHHILEMGKNAEVICFDVSESEQVETAFKAIQQREGSLKVLVNNAGITKDTLVMRMKDSDWDSVLKINLQGTFNCCRSAIKLMVKNNGASIVNIASVVGLHGNAGQANYAASKAGIIGLTYSLAKEYASRSIRVNAVAPGLIDTAMTAVINEDYYEKMKASIPLGRPGTSEEVAQAVSFLAGANSSYITGQVLVIDGGMSI